MGFSRKVYDTLGGFVDPNRGEDIELSIRIKKGGFHLELVKEAYVYHKRRNDFMSFLRQSFSFGQNRVNVNRFHPGAIKAVHLMPALFLGGFLAVLFSYFISPPPIHCRSAPLRGLDYGSAAVSSHWIAFIMGRGIVRFYLLWAAVCLWRRFGDRIT